MKKRIAITGGIGSGKSTALEILRREGYTCYSCDEIYKEVIIDSKYVQRIQEEFPNAVEDGVINRAKLSAIVFHDKNARETLNRIAHHQIMQRLYAHMSKCDARVVFAEVPLLFEGNYQNDFDAVIILMRKKETRIRSVCARDGLEGQDVEARISAQIDYDKWIEEHADTAPLIKIVENDGDFEQLKSSLLKAVKQLS